ncbi:MAG: hypothetical protein ACKO7D_09740 [Bacteroidota bacterium]
MEDSKRKLKRILSEEGLKWNSLYDQPFKHSVFYFGIYETRYKKGFDCAEKLFRIRLDNCMAYLSEIKFAGPKGDYYASRLRENYLNFNYVIDFNSEFFRTKCIEFLLPLKKLIETKYFIVDKRKIRGCLITSEQLKVLKKYFYQLNPSNYMKRELTHLYLIDEKKVSIGIDKSAKRKSLRDLRNKHELIRFITNLETIRIKKESYVEFRFALFEKNPLKNHLESVVMKGVKTNNSFTSAFTQIWIFTKRNYWRLKGTIYR